LMDPIMNGALHLDSLPRAIHGEDRRGSTAHQNMDSKA